MLCAPQASDKRLKGTSRMQCNGLVRSTDGRLLEGQLIHRPVCVFRENRDTTFSGFPLGHCSDWKLARYSSSIQEVNMTSYWASGAAAATEGFELLSPQPTIVHWIDRPNEKNMQDQGIPFKLLRSGGNTLGQNRHRKKVKNSLTTCPTCQVVASTSSGLITAPLISDSDFPHDDGKPPKSSSKKRRNKSKQCRRATRENLNLLPELLRQEQIDAASPAEVLLPDLLVDKLSDTSSCASLSVKDSAAERHISTLESDVKDGAGCTGSSNITAGERLSCKCAPYSNDGPDTADSLEFGGSAVHTGLPLSGTLAEDVTGTSSHTERVQCSSEACSSKLLLPASSGRRGRRSRETSSCDNSTATNRVVGANRQRRSGKDSGISVWQKVEKLNKEKSSGKGHAVVAAVEDKTTAEDTNKCVDHHPSRPIDKHRCRKSCKHYSPDVAVEVGLPTENGTLNSCQKISRCVHKKQTAFLYEQRSLSCKMGSCQSSRNYYAPKNDIPKMLKNHSQQIEGLSMLQLVCAGDVSDRPIANGIDKATGETCTLVIQDDTHSLCVENEVTSPNLNSRNLCADPCAAEMEEPEGVNSYSAAAHMSHKCVPIGKKYIIHLDVPEASVAEVSVPANDASVCANIDVHRNVSHSSEVASKITAKLNSSAQPYSKCQGHIETGTAFSKITEAVCDAYSAQQRAEDIQLLIGRPLADFEQFIYSASPVLYCSSCPTGCDSSSQERISDRLCLHQTAGISLSSIWQWYEEPGCYGLEVKAQDLRRLNGFCNSHYQFNAYFVPYLSAVQLFGQPKRTTGKDAAGTGGARSPCLSSLPILAKLLPKESSNQRSSLSTLPIGGDQQSEAIELLFEFFESEQPFWRRQLFDKVKELIDGAKQSNCQISGDPMNLELNLHDLHPASWYCVAWYPVYRIPDGKFQAAFLTYHSLGHWVHRRRSSDQAGLSHAVLPVMGLQSYNDKGEWWFQTSRSGSEDVDSTDSSCSQISQVLRERVSTLKQAAAAMARADVPSKDQTRSRNRHPDYEFFLSRYR